MSELSSYVQRSSHAVLSSTDLAAIHRRVGQSSGEHRPAIDFELRRGGPVFGVVPLRALPAEWPTWPLSLETTGLGLCLPVDGAGYLGVAMSRWGDASWFSIDEGWAWGDSPPGCQLLDDLCRVRLGLRTETPGRSPDWYWLGCWLADVVEAAADVGQGVADRNTLDGGLLDVMTVAMMHPAVELDELCELDMAGLIGFVVERHREHVQIADWECIRLDALADNGHRFHHFAAALDSGAFSRWVSAASPPLSDLASTLTARCTPLGLRLLGSVIADMVLRERVVP